MAHLGLIKPLVFAAFSLGAAALDLRLGPNANDARHEPPQPTTKTITIPYLGGHTTSTIISHCGTTTVVVETPLVIPTCSSTVSSTTTSTTHEPTTSSTSTSTTHEPTSSSTSTSTTHEPTSSSTSTSTTHEPTSSSTSTSTTHEPTSSSTSTSTTHEPTSSSTSTSVHTTTHVPTTTSTSTSTRSSTTRAVPTPTPGGPCLLIEPGCRAAGLNINYYPNPFAGYSRLGGLPWSYYITETLRPLASSLTDVAFFPQDTGPAASFPKVYPDPAYPTAWYAVGWTKRTNGGIRVDANNFTLVYTGFYRAPETGRYSLCTTADNENDVFFGHGNAFDCFDGETDPHVRPLVVSTGGNYVNGLKCAEVDMVRGAWYPLRSVMGNWQGPSAFNLTIKTPSQTFEQRQNDFSGLAYPYDCGMFIHTRQG